MKYILLLSFLLALLPEQNTQRQAIVKSQDFIATFEHIQSLPNTENVKKPILEGEEPHLIGSDSIRLGACHTAFFYQSYPTPFPKLATPYAIRAPPTIAQV